MDYRVLGPIRVLDEGTESYLNARKIQVLLAALLIRSDQIVSVDQIMTEIWHESPPRRAAASMHVYVSQLRKFLARPDTAGSQVITRAPGYLLSLGEDELDVNEFQRHLSQGRGQLNRGHLDEARRSFSAALAVWRGPALGELRGEGPILRGFVAWAEETRLECLDLQIHTRLALGEHRQLIGQLYQLISENPLQESFYRQLMLALYQTDRQADALHVYQSARATLNAELGVEPCHALRELQHAILVGDVREEQRPPSNGRGRERASFGLVSSRQARATGGTMVAERPAWG